ncbi:MAG: SpoIIE family protein phosphatase [Pseudomonadota bacterium]
MKTLGDCKVLVVDDVKGNINLLVEALKNDYKLGFALNGEAALKYVRAQSPDIILLDIMMPGLDGYEVCRRLKADPATKEIPVLFITSMDEVENKAAGFEAGAVDYITKPFEIVEVKARVKTHLSLKLAMAALEKQRDRMQQSLDLAMEVQQSLLPKRAPRVKGLDVAGTSRYCDETGGDYYDYLDHPDPGRIGLVVGDVAEHGAPSALLMASARALVRQSASTSRESAVILTEINRQICRDVEDSGRFVTLFLADVNVPKKIISWASAGHDPALVYDRKRDAFLELGGSGPALGIMDGFVYEGRQADLAPGQIVVIGTDGIWECHHPEGRMFGKEALKDVIRGNRDLTAPGIVAAVMDAVGAFRRPLEFEDDVTLVVAKVEDT